MMIQVQTHLKQPAVVATRPLRVLSALTSVELNDFFPSGRLEDELDFPFELTQSSTSSARGWADEISEIRPDVIVGAWRTSMLPTIQNGELPTSYYCHFSGSIRHVVTQEHLDAGMLVTNWGASVSPYVAEMALALTLSTLRNFNLHQANIHQRASWRSPHEMAPMSLYGLRVGLHGLGAIAHRYVSLIAPFKTRLSAWDPFASDDVFRQAGVRRAKSLEDLFEKSDVVVECCALTPETKGVVTGTLLERMPYGSTFINIARGALVDEEALARLVTSGHLRAGLDVFQKEPLPTKSSLRDCDMAVLTPHCGGKTVQGRHAVGKFSVDNLNRYARGEALEGIITSQQFARMT